MPQFRLEKELSAGEDSFLLVGAEAFHATKVLRHKVGDALLVFDPVGQRFSGVIEKISEAGEVVGRIVSRFPAAASCVAIHLYQALLKSQAWEDVLKKGTQIGVAHFIPVITSRTAVVFKEESAENKNSRWSKIILSAVKQSERFSTPTISSPLRFPEALEQGLQSGLNLFAWENLSNSGNNAHKISTFLHKAILEKERPIRLNLWIGPEGGFSDEEAKKLQDRGAIPFSLGDNILKAEAAAFAACLLIRYEAGELG
jgi:16S rRNA (uracil1498-N3)-methyltransferase